jgi:regulator-associated protein of mTOR
MYYTDKRHETGGIPKADTYPLQEWRMRDRLKTVSAALAICLNIGVDPPDVVKTNPTAKLECWIDPMTPTTAAPKVMEQIGKKLQEQYESLSIRTRYKQYLDPSVEETKKFCISLRQTPRTNEYCSTIMVTASLPTPSGEMWVFNKNYTQYIPISLYEVQSYLISPCLYVFDCSMLAT